MQATTTAPTLTREKVDRTATLAEELPPGELRNGLYALVRYWKEQNRPEPTAQQQ